MNIVDPRSCFHASKGKVSARPGDQGSRPETLVFRRPPPRPAKSLLSIFRCVSESSRLCLLCSLLLLFIHFTRLHFTSPVFSYSPPFQIYFADMLASFAAVAFLAASARAAPVAVSLATVEAALALPNTTQTNDAVYYHRESQTARARRSLFATGVLTWKS